MTINAKQIQGVRRLIGAYRKLGLDPDRYHFILTKPSDGGAPIWLAVHNSNSLEG